MEFRKALLSLILASGFSACTQMSAKPERSTAGVGDIGSVYQPDVPTKTDTQMVAENLVCVPKPNVPASDTQIIIKIHLDQPIEHMAQVNFAGEVKSTGTVNVYTQKNNEAAQLMYSAPTRFGKEPLAYASELRGSMAIPGASENGWIHIAPNMNKSFLGFGSWKYSGGYTGSVYLSKFGSMWYQNGDLVCAVH